VQIIAAGEAGNTKWRLNVAPKGMVTGYTDQVNNTNYKKYRVDYSGLYIPTEVR
jgi:hypothetical protein